MALTLKNRDCVTTANVHVAIIACTERNFDCIIYLNRYYLKTVAS